jgi:hypothetical protein
MSYKSNIKEVGATLSLNDDAAHMVYREIRRSRMSFKDGVNHYLRLGLVAASIRPRGRL